jgi:alpha-tubulin suppressor-like RCC1 family protein
MISIDTQDAGDLYTFGCNAHGQLGRDTLSESSHLVSTVALPRLAEKGLPSFEDPVTGGASDYSSIVDVSCGSAHTAVVTENGKLWTCGWGNCVSINLFSIRLRIVHCLSLLQRNMSPRKIRTAGKSCSIGI